MILLELNDDMSTLPKEVFLHLNEIYSKADKSNVIVKEYGYSQAASNNFLGAFGGKLLVSYSLNCFNNWISLQVFFISDRLFNAYKASHFQKVHI